MSSNDVILNKIMQQIILNYHPSTIVSLSDIEKAVDINLLLSSFVDEEWDLYKKPNSLEKIKKLVSPYKQYVFTSDALYYLDNYLRLFNEKYPTVEKLIEDFPLFRDQIKDLFLEKEEKKRKTVKFTPKEFKINTNTTLYHTTNAFEIFEQYKSGTPYGASWFNIDSVYQPENIYSFYPNRGAMSVIVYKWIVSHPEVVRTESSRLTKSYPFLDSESIGKSYNPKIMDARKITNIPKEAIEEFLIEKGLETNLHDPDLTKNILEQYGKTWKPIVIEFLKSFGFDGFIADNNELLLFEPERWIFFDSIDQSDDNYLAATELIETYDENKDLYSNANILNYQLIPQIASKYGVDRNLLQLIFQQNKKLL